MSSQASQAESSRALSPLCTAQSDQLQELEQVYTMTATSATSSSETTKTGRPRTAWHWKHMPNPDPQTIYKNSEGVIWRCGHCLKWYRESGGTARP